MAYPRGALQTYSELREVLKRKKSARCTLHIVPFYAKLVTIRLTGNSFFTGTNLCQVHVLTDLGPEFSHFGSMRITQKPLRIRHIMTNAPYYGWVEKEPRPYIFNNYWLAHAFLVQWKKRNKIED